MRRYLFPFLLLAGTTVWGQPAEPFRNGDVVTYVGDSITHGGTYHSIVTLYYVTRYPDRPIRFYNEGIGGDRALSTIHTTPEFTRGHFDVAHDDIARFLLDCAVEWLGSDVVEWQVHRWRYSQPVATYPEPCLFTKVPAPLAVAGDTYAGPGIEGAFLRHGRSGEA